MKGELAASEYIRTEQLATQLGVSATPVREALMALHSEGAVRWEPRRGFRVVPLTRQDVVDLFEVQAFIAGELAARAAQTADDERMSALVRLQSELKSAAGSGNSDTVFHLNHEIHRTINLSGGSGRLTALLNRTLYYVPGNYYSSVHGWVEASVDEHDEIIAAIGARDGERTRTLMRDHIRHSGTLLSLHLAQRGAFDPDPANSA
jgi:DNA-binding GntR family transcriptional regulator